MIEVQNLRKEYGGFVAVEGSSFSVERGEVFGVVGPNGAGKTTTLKMLAGLIEPTGGTATAAGRRAGEPAMQRALGFLPEESPLYEEMTARSYLEFFADLYDVPDDVATERIEDALDRLDLEHRDRRIGNVSKGMKRKVAIARALVNDPDVLIFDEPASGLDPLTTNYIIEFTRQLSEEGKTVIFSAHNLFHVESICDRVVIMNEGEIVARGTVEEIREDHGGTEYHVYATRDAGALEAANAPSPGGGTDEPAPGGVTRENGHYRHVVEDMTAVDRIREAVEADGGRITDIQTHTASLEEIFLEVASEPAADGARAEREATAKRDSASGSVPAGPNDSGPEGGLESEDEPIEGLESKVGSEEGLESEDEPEAET